MVNYEKLGFLVGAGGIAASAYLYAKLKKIAAKVDMSVEELSNKANVDIEQALVDAAIQQVVEREVKRSVERASQAAVVRISEDISAQVRRAVEMAYSDVRSSVSSEIAKQVSRIDIAELKKDVIAKAKEAILEKFDGSLDDVLGEFNRSLESVSKIYESIAGSITKDRKPETVFRIV
jgi:hypothetical protein